MPKFKQPPLKYILMLGKKVEARGRKKGTSKPPRNQLTSHLHHLPCSQLPTLLTNILFSLGIHEPNYGVVNITIFLKWKHREKSETHLVGKYFMYEV